MKRLCIALTLALAPLYSWAQGGLEGLWQMETLKLEQFMHDGQGEVTLWLDARSDFKADGNASGEWTYVLKRAGDDTTELLRLPIAVSATYQFEGEAFTQTLTECTPGEASLHTTVQDDAQMGQLVDKLIGISCLPLGYEFSIPFQRVDDRTLNLGGASAPMIYRRVN